jgi:hypothetical protein
MDNLQSYLALKIRIQGFIDLPHPSPGDQFDDFVFTE